MSNFKKYAVRADQAAKEIFKEYFDAETKMNTAKANYDANHRPNGIWHTDADTIAKYARIEADYMDAKSNYEKVRLSTLNNGDEKLKSIRKELENAVAEEYAINPAHLDNAVLELLKSDVLKPYDYERLITKAEQDGNHTMVRIIAKHAEEKANNSGTRPEDARIFHTIAFRGKSEDGKSYLDTFDVITSIFNRCLKNPPLFTKWDILTGELIEKF